MIRFRPLPSLLPIALAGSLLPSVASEAQAQRRTITTTTQTEVVRRQSLAASSDDNLRRGDADMIREDYEQAMREYRAAVDSLPAAPATEDRRDGAMKKFFDAAMKLAEARITEGRYVDAENAVKVILRPEYDPSYKPAVRLLEHLEDPDYYNKTVGPKFVGKVQQVKQLLSDAQSFYASARYSLAYKRYEQVLSLDPYNDAARKGMEKVDLAEYKHSEDTAYPQTRSHLLGDVARGWELPVRRNALDTESKTNVRTQAEDGTVLMNRKLQRIIIPHIEFRSTTISDAVEYLRQESVRLDTQEPDPENRGVNIFLKLNSNGSAPRPVAAPVAAADPAIPGLPAGADAPTPLPAASASTRISLSLGRIPLLNALGYIAQQANLKVKVEQYAVSLVPITESTEVFVTREFQVPPNFIGNAASGPTGIGGGPLDAAATVAGGGGGATGTRDVTNVGSAVINRQDAETYLKSTGVQFPPGASATYLPATSKLVVRNTQENIDVIEALVSEIRAVVPKQVSIESKFIEVTQNNLKELGFDWTLGQFNIGNNKLFGGGGTSGTGRTVSATDFPFSNPGTGGVVGTTGVTSGNRTGTYGISANAIDALIFGSGAAAAAPGILSLAGVFTDPQFQLVVRALNQQKGVDLLSAPRVTTKSGQKATVEIIREFIYPTQFQPPQIPQSVGTTTSFGLGVGGGGSSGSFPVTPTTPTAFEKRNTGVTLEVEPVIGPDNYTIDLNLQPQVVEFDGFINYGSPISTTNSLGMSVVLTPNVINQPIFSTRKVSTSVSVYDGATVVLGGLVREDIQKVNDKVPILGDVPLIGRLFRDKIDQNIKRNLVIFVTARLIDPSGTPILNTDEEEEVVTPLNGPDNYVTPTGPLPLFPKK